MYKSEKSKEEIAVERFLSNAWKEIKRDYKKMLSFMLFYKPKDNADKYWHLLEIICIDVVLLKVFGLI